MMPSVEMIKKNGARIFFSVFFNLFVFSFMHYDVFYLSYELFILLIIYVYLNCLFIIIIIFVPFCFYNCIIRLFSVLSFINSIIYLHIFVFQIGL